MTNSDPLFLEFEKELNAIEPPITLVLRASTAIVLAGVMQLALRHPNLLDHPQRNSTRVSKTILENLRAYFRDQRALACLEVLRRGDAPSGELPALRSEHDTSTVELVDTKIMSPGEIQAELKRSMDNKPMAAWPPEVVEQVLHELATSGDIRAVVLERDSDIGMHIFGAPSHTLVEVLEKSVEAYKQLLAQHEAANA